MQDLITMQCGRCAHVQLTGYSDRDMCRNCGRIGTWVQPDPTEPMVQVLNACAVTLNRYGPAARAESLEEMAEEYPMRIPREARP